MYASQLFRPPSQLRSAKNPDSSPLLQILRYSALFGGIGYGFSHQRTIYARDRVAHEHAEDKRQDDLLAKARKAWETKKNPPSGSGGMSFGPLQLPMDLPLVCKKVL